jgi:hypothetical protein
VELEPLRGTNVIGAAIPIAIGISPVTKLMASTGAVSRYKVGRKLKFITVQELNCGQVSVSSFKMLSEFIWPTEQLMMLKDQKKKEGSGP